MSTTTLGNCARLLDTMVKMYGPDKVVPAGFGPPHSHRGVYTEVAFPPAYDCTLGQLQYHVQAALSETFEGYKGGEYHYDADTPIHLAEWGRNLDPDGDYFTMRLASIIMDGML